MTFDDFLRRACPPLDLEWRRYRRRAARHGVQDRLRELGLNGYGEYLELLREDPGEAAGLAERMNVTVSRFFRDREVWEELGRRVLPGLTAALPPGRKLRAWSVGCGGGEEPYSLVLLWLRDPPAAAGLELLASDVDPAALDRGREACYREISLRELPGPLRERWFRRQGEFLCLDPLVAEPVRFERRNFMDSLPPGSWDLVLARYLPFTYYRGERRREALLRLRRALRPGGALVIGQKERLSPGEEEFFVPWRGVPSVYRCGA